MMTIQTEWLALGILDVVISATIIAAVWLAPKYVLFGVYVPEVDRERPDVQQVRARHRLAMLVLWALGLALGVVWGAWGGDGFSAGRPELALWVALIVQIGGLIPIWASGRRQALELKRVRNWSAEKPSKVVVDLFFRRSQRLVGNGWFVLQLAIVAVCVISAVLHWNAIPDPVPTHFGITGEPDRYSPKNFGSVFMLNIVQLGLIGIFVMVNMSIRSARQQLDPARPEASRENQLRYRRANSIFVYALSMFVVVLLGLGQSVTVYGWPTKELNALMFGLPALLIAAVFGFVWYVSRHGLDEAAAVAQTQEDNFWRGGGLFYYNKADPALMVEKRYGAGWTINFAHPLGILIFAGMLLVPIAIVIIASLAT